MNNFTYHNPTRLEFGKNTISRLPNLIPKGEKVFLLFGGGSIKKNGVWDQVYDALEGYDIISFGGIEANPDYETCLKAVDEIQKTSRSFILGVGGGSVLDAAKFIAAAAWARESSPQTLDGKTPWDLITRKAKIAGALPIGAVLTLPATGSEMNANSVISWRNQKEKRGFSSPHLYPRFSIMDPETTYSLPERQTVNGIADAFVHVAEQYLTRDINTPIQDRMAEGVMKTLISEGPQVVKNPLNYELRANIMWACTMALNGLIGVGTVQDWASHGIGHELTALYGIDHGRTLAVVLPGVLEQQKANKSQKLLMYARNVWNLHQGDDQVLMDEAIARTVLFFETLGIGTRLRDYPGTDRAPELISEKLKNTPLGENGQISSAEVREILELRA